MGLFDSKKNTTTNYADQRVVNDAGGGVIAGAGALVSYAVNDPSVVGQVAGYAAQVAGQQTDGVRAVAQFGADQIGKLGESVVDLTAQAGSNAATAWGHTLDVAGDALDKAFNAQAATLKTAQGLAEKAIGAYTPTDSKMGDAVKWAAIAGAVLIGLALVRGVKGG